MPPQMTDISDGSDVAHDELPDRPKPVAADDDAASESDAGEEEAEYVVEVIRGHSGVGNKARYEIKWLGYDDSENTWEPYENLMPDAADAVLAYETKIGFSPHATTSKGVKRSQSKSNLKASQAATASPPAKKSRRQESDDDSGKGWQPKNVSWENHVDKITMVERDEDTNELMAFIQWKDRSKEGIRVNMQQIYLHCPIKMLKFYEDHLKFTSEL